MYCIKYELLSIQQKKYCKKQRKTVLKKKLLSIIFWRKKHLRKDVKIWTGDEKQAKKEYQKSYYKKLNAYKDELLLEKAKRGKESGQLLQKKRKKRNKCKNKSKIRIEKH